mmetsp:Transcript_7314/g.11617  ORF Transcript_7314/g.11617 Transcript_7314/m.11617 type:complete len:139 (+) Transcript_7314:231-647(+)|eukprot:CAMPEP_0184677326 /NCGR_PEP_ID=MMETSP0308-20130426/88824_1 /TAXON_ID=38269 /ORGANISM="Gloeochaete witrockiana, Strain SAG 46.84" /LENGTH=138 /DNA_ID=CAMNT_0027125211 /DNA_START=208 /DNA_END=624 /DNA_ORIENTATION=+
MIAKEECLQTEMQSSSITRYAVLPNNKFQNPLDSNSQWTHDLHLCVFRFSTSDYKSSPHSNVKERREHGSYSAESTPSYANQKPRAHCRLAIVDGGDGTHSPHLALQYKKSSIQLCKDVAKGFKMKNEDADEYEQERH